MIAEWKQRYPLSINHVLVDAQYHIDLAWKWRGNDYAAKVPKENWPLFRSELAQARQILETNPQTKISPQYFVEMQTIALGEGWKKENYFTLFSEAIASEPEYYRFYFAASYYLLPKWHGKKGDWEKFAEEQRERVSGAAGDALYARIAWSRSSDYDRFFQETAISWKTMAAGFDVMMQQYPDSKFNRNTYAHFACLAGDRDRLRALLPAVKAEPDMEVWVNLRNLQLAEKFANETESLKH